MSLAEAEDRKAYYLEHIRRNQDAILDAAALGFDPPIRGCPGWDVGALAAHMVRVYTFWLKWVSERPRGFDEDAWKEILAEREENLPGYGAYVESGCPPDARPEGILEAARATGERLDAALVQLEPAESVWTFIPAHQNGAFVFRRLAMETAVHRWDAEDAHGLNEPIDEELARDGIDEMLMMYREDPAYEENQSNRHGQRVLLRDAGGTACWLVTFGENGLDYRAGDGPADATIRGSASDLLLYVNGRVSAERLQVEGDWNLAAAWGDLAGRF